VIPVESLQGSKCIRLYPEGKGPRTATSYEGYREAWRLLKDEKSAENSGTQPNCDFEPKRSVIAEEKTASRKKKNASVKAELIGESERHPEGAKLIASS
jgi:hypothetical protein